MILIAPYVGLVFWLLDSAVDSFLLNKSTFLHQVFSSEADELWMRLFVLLTFISFGYYSGVIISRAEKADGDVEAMTGNSPRLS